MSQPTEESFLKDVASHSMKILKDDGVYRHLQFSNNGSWNQRFDIVTWPGYLAYSGDMGCFVFSRLADMFEFFRTKPSGSTEKLFINEGYWGEKLEAVDRDGRQSSHLRFDADSLRAHVEEIVKEWLGDEDLTQEEKEELEYEVQSDVLYRIEDGDEYGSRNAVSSFSYTLGSQKYIPTRDLVCGVSTRGHRYEFTDSWEWDCTEYTYRFIWCCYALAWGIQMYDKVKEEDNAQEQG
jgi:hypothetical protein